jgi:hypothetical protein
MRFEMLHGCEWFGLSLVERWLLSTKLWQCNLVLKSHLSTSLCEGWTVCFLEPQTPSDWNVFMTFFWFSPGRLVVLFSQWISKDVGSFVSKKKKKENPMLLQNFALGKNSTFFYFLKQMAFIPIWETNNIQNQGLLVLAKRNSHNFLGLHILVWSSSSLGESVIICKRIRFTHNISLMFSKWVEDRRTSEMGS